jgi:transposase InsO family protein
VSRACSVSAKRVYGKARVCRLWGVARSTHYARRAVAERPVQTQRRGRRPELADEALLVKIREVLAEAEALGFRGEGYRKVWARLRHRGIPFSKERVRRLMREHGLQAPHRAGTQRGPRVHDGTIIPAGANRMWGTDATQVPTRLEGMATVFVAVDHFVGDVVGIHAARPGTRFEALEPIHQGIREHLGPLSEGVAEGLVLRHDHGPQYMSHAFQQELGFLGIESSPSFVRAPEGNGVAERFIRTLKEQLLWVRTFDTVEELRRALLEFKERFNKHWLLQRHGYATPAKVRAAHTPLAEAA